MRGRAAARAREIAVLILGPQQRFVKPPERDRPEGDLPQRVVDLLERDVLLSEQRIAGLTRSVKHARISASMRSVFASGPWPSRSRAPAPGSRRRPGVWPRRARRRRGARRGVGPRNCSGSVRRAIGYVAPANARCPPRGFTQAASSWRPDQNALSFSRALDTRPPFRAPDVTGRATPHEAESP